jgi:voltage-gated potassium channel
MQNKLIRRFYLPGALVYVFLLTWQLMRIFEPNAPIVSIKVFWSYFLVTSIAPGLTGYVPTSMWGKLTAELIYICGAAALTAIAVKIIYAAREIETKKLKGLVKMNCSNHVIVLGYREGDTEAIITEILVGNPTAKIVLCSMRIKENPMPEKIDFVYGDNTADDTLDRACIGEAKKILIYGHTDDRAIAVAIAVKCRASKDAHVTSDVLAFDPSLRNIDIY